MADGGEPAARADPSVTERIRRADLWEAGADERERLADERERLADEREALADQRDAMADRQERALDHREADARRGCGPAVDDADVATERAATRAALHRAEAAVRRAEAELLRARQAAARVEARAARRTAGVLRAVAADDTGASDDPQELAWLAERRDFVAAERDRSADHRDRLADQRDRDADERERTADAWERESLERDRRLTGRRSPDRTPADEVRARRRAQDGRNREIASSRRHAAARDRGRAAEEWGPQPYGPLLTAGFATLIQRLFAAEHLPTLLPSLLDFAVDAVSGCDRASAWLYRDRLPGWHVATDAAAAELDAVQSDTGAGPILDAMRDGDPVNVHHLDESTRWPELAAAARRRGVCNALCYPLADQQSGDAAPLGSLHLYGPGPHAFGTGEQHAGQVVAALLGAALAAARRHAELGLREAALHRSLSTRDVIGQAKGILMERQRLPAGEAFDVLRQASQQLNRKLVDVAGYLARTGQLPG